MIKNRFIKNTSWIIVGQVIRMLLSFLINVLTARYLGPDNNGVINYVSSYIAFFTSLVGLGFNGIIIYELVNRREEEGKILGTAILLRFLAGIVSAVAFIGIILLTDGEEKVIVIVALLQAIQLPFLCLDTIDYWYQSNMNSKYSVIAQTTAYFVMTAYKIYLLISGKSVEWFAFSVTLDIIILGIFYYAFYSRHKKQRLGCSFSTAKRLMRGSLPFVIAGIMTVIYGHMDRIMIKHLLNSNGQVGFYSAALAICSIIGFIPIAILDSARPLIVEAKNESEEKYYKKFEMLLFGIIWICVLYSVFIMIFAKPIVYLLYGDAYKPAVMCLRISVWYTAFSYLGNAKDLWLVCENKKNYVMIFYIIGTVCNLVMNFIFIPLCGINGAAFATLMTQIITNFIVPLLFKKTRAYSKCAVNAMLFKNINIKEISALIDKKIRKVE